MMAVPAETAVTTPVETATVATAGLLLLHVPPAVGWVITIESFTHTCDSPPTTAGSVITVTSFTARQPLPSVYVTGMIPAVIPLTTPVSVWIVPYTVDVGVWLHVPPAGEPE